MKNLIIALVLAIGSVGAAAMPALAQLPAGMELGPKVGAKAPNVSVVSPAGEKRKLGDLYGSKGVTLVFYRSADWCPFCKLQLKNLNTVAADLETSGWPLVGISYDSAETLMKFTAAEKLTYPLVTDPGSATIDAFGLRNEAMNGKPRFEGIPHPIILFVGKDGMVKAKLYEEAYQKRPPADVVLATAKGLK